MSNYPPGVTGNEPQITGEWPCLLCDGEGGNPEDGSCPHCKGTGLEPEEFDVEYIEELVENEVTGTDIIESILDATRCCIFNRENPEHRRYLHAVAKLKRNLRV